MVDHRNCSFFQHDPCKCNEEPFINDFKELSWEDISDVIVSLNSKFDNFYENVHITVIQPAL